MFCFNGLLRVWLRGFMGLSKVFNGLLKVLLKGVLLVCQFFNGSLRVCFKGLFNGFQWCVKGFVKRGFMGLSTVF